MAHLSLTTVAALTPADWEVTIHDARAEPVDFDAEVDLVGLTAFTAEAPDAYRIADGFRARGVPVVIGGIHATALPEEAGAHADAVVLGEAESLWETVLRDAERGELKPRYRAEEHCDMQHQPVPRRELLDRSMFVTGYYTLQATRGCPFDCDYCAVTGVFGRKFRTRPVEHVIEEIRNFDSKEFFFVDDNICGHPKYAKRLFRELIPLGKTWGGQTSITFANDPEMLELYAKSGGRYAFIGLESISEESLAGVNKGWSKAGDYAEAFKRIHAAGINILGSFIFGLEEDDPGVFDRTLEFCRSSGVDAAQFHMLTPFPGTRLFDRMESEGRILTREWEKYHTGECVIQPKKMTPEELERGYYRAYKEFYSVPNILRRVFARPRGIPNRMYMNFGYRHRAQRMPDV
jgi:radical SAM superfamily enzyme YgiQ (UPF0313 family)